MASRHVTDKNAGRWKGSPDRPAAMRELRALEAALRKAFGPLTIAKAVRGLIEQHGDRLARAPVAVS